MWGSRSGDTTSSGRGSFPAATGRSKRRQPFFDDGWLVARDFTSTALIARAKLGRLDSSLYVLKH